MFARLKLLKIPPGFTSYFDVSLEAWAHWPPPATFVLCCPGCLCCEFVQLPPCFATSRARAVLQRARTCAWTAARACCEIDDELCLATLHVRSIGSTAGAQAAAGHPCGRPTWTQRRPVSVNLPPPSPGCRLVPLCTIRCSRAQQLRTGAAVRRCGTHETWQHAYNKPVQRTGEPNSFKTACRGHLFGVRGDPGALLRGLRCSTGCRTSA